MQPILSSIRPPSFPHPLPCPQFFTFPTQVLWRDIVVKWPETVKVPIDYSDGEL